MIKVHPIVRGVVESEPEAVFALVNGFMNMSRYAGRIRAEVEKKAKKKVTQTSLVVALSRVRKELKKTKPLAPKVVVDNITTKLPLSELVYESTTKMLERLETLHKRVSIPREDFFTATVGTTELTIVCSSGIVGEIKKHFGTKPKLCVDNLASVGVSFKPEYYIEVPNVIFSLVSALARTRINIAEIVSTYTELIFIVEQKDFATAVGVFSDLHEHSREK